MICGRPRDGRIGQGRARGHCKGASSRTYIGRSNLGMMLGLFVTLRGECEAYLGGNEGRETADLGEAHLVG
jgi:hypothetical protein